MEKYNIRRQGMISLIPLALFLLVYLGGSAIIGDFYRIPMTVAFLVASAVAIGISRGGLQKRITRFSAGASDKNIMLMVWIYILAGAFAEAARGMGAVEATVNLTLHLLPASMIFVGLFVAAAFVSLAIGTSVGTIVALTPIAVGVAAQVGHTPAEMAAIVVGGSYFGDNLSFISDTTIAATQTQGCKMADKFKMNIRLVAPAAIIMVIVYAIMGLRASTDASALGDVDLAAVLPYIAVIGLSVVGLNVLVVLTVGIVLAGIVGLACGTVPFWGFLAELKTGMGQMGELVIVALLAGGMLEVIRVNGGIRYIIGQMSRHVSGRRGAEAAIGATVCLANLCTANNTVAIITVGRIVRDMAQRFGVDPRRAASLLDTFSCFTQGLLPYGVQMLLAASIAGCSPLEIVPHLFYPMLIGISAIVSVGLKKDKRSEQN